MITDIIIEHILAAALRKADDAPRDLFTEPEEVVVAPPPPRSWRRRKGERLADRLDPKLIRAWRALPPSRRRADIVAAGLLVGRCLAA